MLRMEGWPASPPCATPRPDRCLTGFSVPDAFSLLSSSQVAQKREATHLPHGCGVLAQDIFPVRDLYSSLVWVLLTAEGVQLKGRGPAPLEEISIQLHRVLPTSVDIHFTAEIVLAWGSCRVRKPGILLWRHACPCGLRCVWLPECLALIGGAWVLPEAVEAVNVPRVVSSCVLILATHELMYCYCWGRHRKMRQQNVRCRK